MCFVNICRQHTICRMTTKAQSHVSCILFLHIIRVQAVIIAVYVLQCIFTNRIIDGGDAIGCIHLSIRLFVSTLSFELNDCWPWTFACRGLKVKVKVMGQADAVYRTSIEGIFSRVIWY